MVRSSRIITVEGHANSVPPRGAKTGRRNAKPNVRTARYLTDTSQGATIVAGQTRESTMAKQEKDNQSEDQETVEQGRREFLKGSGLAAGGLAATAVAGTSTASAADAEC